MNYLLCTGRQLNVYEEWIALGVRHLLQMMYKEPIQWVLYDKNPDLQSTPKIGTDFASLQSNSFHHQTLLPFSAVVLTGSSVWTGSSMERLFSILSKMEIPLLAIGLELPTNLRPFSPSELACFARQSTVLTVKNEATREWLRRFDLESNLVGCPSLFAPSNSALSRDRPEGTNGITFCLEDSYQNKHTPETLVRKIVRAIPKISTSFPTQLACTHLDDFMRFSTMFPGLVRYSYDARDYFPIFETSSLILTTSLATATIVNAMEKPVILLTNEKKANPISEMPFVYPHAFTTAESLEETIASFLQAPSMQAKIRAWKETQKKNWTSLFNPYEPNIRKAA